MTTTEANICPVCDSQNNRKVFHTFDYLVTGKNFDIIECNKCTLRFTFPLSNPQKIGKYYQSEDYISHTDIGNSMINILYKFVQRFTMRLRARIVENYSGLTSGSILDIGCGTGLFLVEMQINRWNISGVEISESAQRFAQEITDTKIYNQDEFMQSLPQYDVITLWHTLEHLYDLKKYMYKISASLKNKGIVIVAVPNYMSLDADYYQHDWAAYDVPRHCYHFSKMAMNKLFNECGFTLVDIKHMPFDPFYVSLLSEFKVRKKRNIFKALWIGWRSFWNGRKDTNRASSIMYVFEKSNIVSKEKSKNKSTNSGSNKQINFFDYK